MIKDSIYIQRSLRYYWQQHFILLAGIIIATAVITGSLIVGDSVKDGLKSLIETRLGKTNFAIVSGSRLMRYELSTEISRKLSNPTAGILLLQGIVINPETSERVNGVQVNGIRTDFSKINEIGFPIVVDDEAIISTIMAKKLSLKINDYFLLRVNNTDAMPVNTPFSNNSKATIALRLKVKAIAGSEMMGYFSLRNNQQLENNVFVSHEMISKKINVSGAINLILVFKKDTNSLTINSVNKALSTSWRLNDAGFNWEMSSDSSYYELNSDRVFIDHILSSRIEKSDLKFQIFFSYLVNSISLRDKETPYSFVTSVNEPLFDSNSKSDEILINQWLANDLSAKIGDTLSLDYYVIGPLHTINEKSSRFIVRDIIPNQSDFVDSSLMPSFPGLSDAGSCKDWEAGVPIKFSKIRDKDEVYWNTYKGTPKAFIPYSAGLELWSNPFGNATAIRFNNSKSLAHTNDKLINLLELKDLGIAIIDIQSEAVYAAENSVNFSELFISLSFFIIVAAFILVVLLHSLNLAKRASEEAVLNSIGYTTKHVIKLRFIESFVVVVFGSILGLLFAIMYTKLILLALNGVWNNALHTQLMSISIHFKTLLTGFIISILVSYASIIIITLRMRRKSIISRIQNYAGKTNSFVKWCMLFCTIVPILFLVNSMLYKPLRHDVFFLIAGFLLLIGGILFVKIKLEGISSNLVSNVFLLAFKNARSNISRSIAVITILAFGTFCVIITGAFYKYELQESDKSSGTGGYLYWLESTAPIVKDLNSKEALANLIFEKDEDTAGLFFTQLLTRRGGDASCLNLNQIKQPRLLGVNYKTFNSRNAFTIKKLLYGISMKPWLSLIYVDSLQYIPAFADQTVITYGLKKSIGDTLSYIDEYGSRLVFKLIGAIDNSIFQGSLLIDEKVLIMHFPSTYQANIVLVDAKLENAPAVLKMLNKSFSEYGAEVKTTVDRLNEFNSVENTYISVFMILGAMGLVIGTFGLAIILLKNINERKYEFILMSSIGYCKRKIENIILLENIFLLIIGLLVGIVSAIVSIMPVLNMAESSFPIVFLGCLVLCLFTNGFFCIYFAAKFASRTNLFLSIKAD